MQVLLLKSGGWYIPHFPSFYCVIKQNSYLRITPFRGWHRWNIHKTIKQQKCNHWDAQKLHCSGPGANWGSMCSYGSNFPSFSGTTSTVSFWKPFFALGTIRHDRSISVSLKIFILSVNPRFRLFHTVLAISAVSAWKNKGEKGSLMWKKT